ncbi:hypothetical protein MXD61_09130 [Frankia sp. AgPm24]|uniref:Ethyl tert-butyl ether degradation EthD n=1 Tax=Frankia umida TaxID=573489 RepID=A0ABT0K0A6_9ACTN|nr:MULTISPECIES: DUF4286 family protein [Frankia]MCK9876723.1 hypothetical protein [Frankia umida]MCK9922043.1 hypothetical protein [Frankia sp. AgPm24]
MAKGILLVQSRPISPEAEAEYNRWYDEEHIPDVLKVPGIVSARRLRARDAGPIRVSGEAQPYIIVYELEADDLNTPMDELAKRTAEGSVTLSDTIDRPSLTTVYELID